MASVEIRSQVLAARLVIAAIIVLALYVGKDILSPLGLAILMAFMLQPMVRWLRRRGLPNGAAVALTSTVFFAVLSLVIWAIAGQVQALASEIPTYRENLATKITQIRGTLRGGSIDALKSTMTDVMEEVEEKERVNAPEDSKAAAASATGPSKEGADSGDSAVRPPKPEEPKPAKVIVTNEDTPVEEFAMAAGMLAPLGTVGLVMLLVVLLLLKWADLRGRLIALVGYNLTTTTAALDDAAQRVSRYLATQFMINAGTGLVVWAGLSIIGLEYAGLMGLCAGLFRYVPYVGPLAAAALPVAFSVASSDQGEWGMVIAVVAMFGVMELLLNNVIEPWVYGSRLGVSELGIILAAVAWTMLWGPVGLVLATPLTVCLVVLGQNVTGLAFISKILSDRVHLPVHARLTQRLMAGDTIEAADILADYRDEASADDTYDAVVVPVLSNVRHEQRLGHLEEATAAGIAASLPAMLANAASPDPEVPATLTKDSTFLVWSLCPITEAAATLLPDRFRQLPCEFVLYTAQSLVSDVVAEVKVHSPLGLGLLHLDPGDYPRVTATLRRLHRAVPELPILVGRWGEAPLSPGEREELTTLGASALVATPAELAAWISPRAVNVARVLPTP